MNDIRSVVWYGLLIIVLLYQQADLLDGACVKEGKCSCRNDADSSQLIDLSQINGLPLSVGDGLSSTFKIDPCSGLICGQTSNVAVCQEQAAYPTSYYDNGDLSTISFTQSGDDVQVKFTAPGTSCYPTAANRISLITLKCAPTDAADTLKLSSVNVCNFNFEISGPNVCYKTTDGGGSGGLSVGDVLLIIFFVGLLLYFIIGAIVLKFVFHKETGIDLIVNRTFWMELPFLARDGFMFVVHNTCCRNSKGSNYENI